MPLGPLQAALQKKPGPRPWSEEVCNNLLNTEPSFAEVVMGPILSHYFHKYPANRKLALYVIRAIS